MTYIESIRVRNWNVSSKLRVESSEIAFLVQTHECTLDLQWRIESGGFICRLRFWAMSSEGGVETSENAGNPPPRVGPKRGYDLTGELPQNDAAAGTRDFHNFI